MDNLKNHTTKQFFLTAVLWVVMSAGEAFPGEFTTDFVLKAFHISRAQEEPFACDGKLSDFFTPFDVEYNRVGSEMLDSISMTPESNGRVDGDNSFKGPDDASLKVRAAFGESALYLMFEITDNVWIDDNRVNPRLGDNLSVYLDLQSSQEIQNADTMGLDPPGSWKKWAFTDKSIAFNVGAGWLDNSLHSNVQIIQYAGSALSFNSVDTGSLASEFPGLKFDNIQFSNTVRRMEWRIPWTLVGNGGGVGIMPAIGQSIAFSVEYNDVDSVGQIGRKFLIWRENNPFNTRVANQAWGDIVIEGFGSQNGFQFTSPQKGDVLVGGRECVISWTSLGAVSLDTLKHSVDKGNTWSVIATAMTDSGLYKWTVPVGISALECRFMMVVDWSDRYFYHLPSTPHPQFFSTGGTFSHISPTFAIIDTATTITRPGRTVNHNQPVKTSLEIIQRDRSRGALTFNVGIGSPGNLGIEIFDPDGQLVQRLDCGRVSVGYHTFGWDGKGLHGRVLRNGCYYARMRVGESLIMKSFLTVR